MELYNIYHSARFMYDLLRG